MLSSEEIEVLLKVARIPIGEREATIVRTVKALDLTNYEAKKLENCFRRLFKIMDEAGIAKKLNDELN